MKKSAQWKLLADLNISPKTVQFLQQQGLDVIRVDKSVATDEGVVNIAQTENRVILTFDKDFGEIYYFHKMKSITVIVLYLEDQTSEAVNKILKNLFDEMSFVEIKNKLIIVYEGRYRIIS